MTNEPSSVQPGSPPRPILNAFFLPRGLLGRLGGRLMARGLPQQREIADLVSNPGTNLCEIGCGPGVLGALLAERHQQLRLHLIDLSPIMRSQAARRCQQWQSNGRLDISDGTADQTSPSRRVLRHRRRRQQSRHVARPRSQLKAIKRVLGLRGHVVLSWHSATASSSTSRRLALSDDVTGRLTAALQATFGDFQRHDLTESVAWEAQRKE